MTAEASMSTTARLSDRLTVTLTASRIGVTCEWTPTRPKRLTAAELAAYRAARDGLLVRLAEQIGGAVLVVQRD